MATITIIDVYHGVNRFLGTIAGELTKNAFELILFTVVTYMVASEWTRSRQDREKLQWLLWGFACLSLTKLLTTLALSFLVFGNVYNHLFVAQTSVLDNTFEILALVMIGIGFLQPVLSKIHPRFLPKRRYIIIAFLIAGTVFFLTVSYNLLQQPENLLVANPMTTQFNIAKIMISLLVIGYIRSNRKSFLSFSRYYPNVIQAMAVYAVTPTIQLINNFFFDNLSGELLVLAKPFPFIAVLLFTRVIFLHLADKAALYDELATAQAKYQHEKELSDLKDDFISTVSHELKTPLTAIALWGTLLGKEKLGAVTKKQKEACDIIKTESWRLSHLINDVLDLSRLDKGKIALKLEQVDLRKTCNLDSFKAIAQEKRVGLLNKVPEGMIAEIDPERFKQVVYNLVSNALKFTEPGGNVSISASGVGSEILVVVSDTGIGIPADKLDGLFAKFYQVENHLTRKSGGTGLGLAISKQIVELHGGVITAESQLGKGSTFTIRLPSKITLKNN